MSMDASVLKGEIIAAIESAMSSVDMNPTTNPDLSSDVSNALWGAVATSIVDHLKDNMSVGFTGNESASSDDFLMISNDNTLVTAGSASISTTVE